MDSVAMDSATMDLAPTDAAWLTTVLEDFDSFLQDHASCEKKASGMALNIASHYPDKPELVNAMADLAVEELSHYREVVRLLTDRGLTPGADTRDPYVRGMNALVRHGPENFLLDRLLVAAVIERRGFERFNLIAQALPNGSEQRFYQAISASEDRHWQLFVRLAATHCGVAGGNGGQPAGPDIPGRLSELVAAEALIIQGLPLRAALH